MAMDVPTILRLPARQSGKAVCIHCGSDRIAVPDVDGRLNKACPNCGETRLAWVPQANNMGGARAAR